MILDTFLSYEQKTYIAVLTAGLWIYFRTSNCYDFIPRLHIFPVIFVMVWTYLNYHEPLFLPIGLVILIIYAYTPVFLQNTKLGDSNDKKCSIKID